MEIQFYKITLAAVLTANVVLTWPSLTITSDAFRYRATPMLYINGKGHKSELKST